MRETLARATAESISAGPPVVIGARAESTSNRVQRLRPAAKPAARPAYIQATVTNEIDCLYQALGCVTAASNPRTIRMLEAKTRKLAQKVIEEAGEVAIEATRRDRGGIIRESADLLYQMAVLWRREGIEPEDIWAEMRGRAARLGIAEKLPKLRYRKPPGSNPIND